MNNYDLKQELKQRGLTQKQFAELAGIAENTVSQWVRGERSLPGWVKPFLELYDKAETLDKIMTELQKLQK